jgi:hypothetical protein
VPIDAHGSLDRAKDLSSYMGRVVARLPSRVRTLSVRRRRSPPAATRGHPLVASPTARGGRDLPQTLETDRPRPTLVRQPAKVAGILWIRVPSTVATRARERIAPLRFPCAGLSLTPPTRCPQGGDRCLFTGIASVAVGGSARAETSREQVTFLTRWIARAWD